MAREQEAAPAAKVSFFPAWCKRCGNCVEFCPRKALDHDEWGYPLLARPEACTVCGLCEMLCPDFAISVGEPPSAQEAEAATPAPGTPGSPVSPQHSPERLAPGEEDDDA
jgi:2-oxoglutarate ferredoxin oxidoreductase subunit delta